MADFSVNPVAQNIKPPTPMSLADMVNLARSGQAFQQAQQINPLEVQKARTELSRLQQLMPEELIKAQAQASQAVTEADVSEKTSKPRVTSATATASSSESTAERDRLNLLAQKQKQIASSQISMINNPLIIEAERNPNAANREALVNLVKQNGMTMARDLNIKPDEAIKLLQPYLDIAANDPSKLRQYFKERHIQGLDESARTAALSPSGIGIDYGTGGQTTSTNEFSGVRVGQPIPGTAFNRQLMPGESIVTDATGNNFIQSKDSQGRISIRPVTEGGSSIAPSSSSITNAPVQNVPPQVQNLPPARVAPPQRQNVPSADVAPKPNAMVQNLPQNVQANVPEFSQPIPPRFPVRQPGQPVFNLQQGEKEAQEAGGKFLRESIANRNAIPAFRNNVEKIILSTDKLLDKTITKAGKGLQIEQYFDKLIDDSEYKTLSKQLANLQIQMSGTPNMSTDAGKTMASAATGDATYPPQVLQKIAIQLHGEMEAKDKLGTAADRYARKFGETNMPSFGQMWNNNADAKVFELMSLPKLVKDPALRAKMADEIIGHPRNSEQRKVFEQKYMNIQKLIKDGTL